MLEMKNTQSTKINSSGKFYGYASVFGNIDQHGDIIQKGAFQKSLNEKKFTLLFWQHSVEPVGEIEECYEDEIGLRIKGYFFTAVQIGYYANYLHKQNFIFGLSVGFRIKDYKIKDQVQEEIRIITDADLIEVSMVTHAANERAKLDFYKEDDICQI